MTTVRFEDDAKANIQRVYDDPTLEQLADRLEEMLELLEKNPTADVLRRKRMQQPALWLVKIYGSQEEFAFLWDIEKDDPWVRWAGFSPL